MCVPISRTNTWRPNQTWKPPRSFWLHFSVFKVRDCHNKHRGQQVGEPFLQPPCALTQWGPPAASQTRLVLSARQRWGIRSLCRATGGTDEWRLFIWKPHVNWGERMSGRAASSQTSRSEWAGFSRPKTSSFTLGWTNTVRVYIFGRTKRNTHARMCRSYKSRTITASNHPDRRQNSILNPPNFPSVHVCGTLPEQDNYLCRPLKADQSRRGDPLGTVRLYKRISSVNISP